MSEHHAAHLKSVETLAGRVEVATRDISNHNASHISTFGMVYKTLDELREANSNACDEHGKLLANFKEASVHTTYRFLVWEVR